jgi:hypothetical protein
VGCGKSAILGEIEIALRALGIPIVHADPIAWRSEKNTTHADWQRQLDLYKPVVLLDERVTKSFEYPSFSGATRKR